MCYSVGIATRIGCTPEFRHRFQQPERTALRINNVVIKIFFYILSRRTQGMANKEVIGQRKEHGERMVQ